MSRHALLHLLAVLLLALVLLVAVRLHSAAAAPIDPHALYERACTRCHPGHAVELVRKSIRRVDGEVVGAHRGTPISRLLAAHMGVELGPQEIALLTRHFEQMLSTGFVFQEKCIVCHDRASELARLHLVEREGRLVGRYSGRDIASFLTGHGRLTPPELETITTMLHRQLDAGEPPPEQAGTGVAAPPPAPN